MQTSSGWADSQGRNLSGAPTVADRPIDWLFVARWRKADRDKDKRSPRFVPDKV